MTLRDELMQLLNRLQHGSEPMEEMLHSCYLMLRNASFPCQPHPGSSVFMTRPMASQHRVLRQRLVAVCPVTCAVGDEDGFPRRVWLGSPLARQDDDEVVQQGYGSSCGCTKRKADSATKKSGVC